MINSFKNPAIMRILRTTERHGAGWREQNFIPSDEVIRRKRPVKSAVCGLKNDMVRQEYDKINSLKGLK